MTQKEASFSTQTYWQWIEWWNSKTVVASNTFYFYVKLLKLKIDTASTHSINNQQQHSIQHKTKENANFAAANLTCVSPIKSTFDCKFIHSTLKFNFGGTRFFAFAFAAAVFLHDYTRCASAIRNRKTAPSTPRQLLYQAELKPATNNWPRANKNKK